MLKSLSFAIALALPASAFATSLRPFYFCVEGASYSRTVPTGGFFGQPVGERSHTISFLEDNQLIDNANTFFGNPPEQLSYVGSSFDKIEVQHDGYIATYKISSDCQTLTNGDVVLTRD